MITMDFMMSPEESYSRKLDKHVARQEKPYGFDYPSGFAETMMKIEEVERINRREGRSGKKETK
jgi:hypothetical protein